MDAGPLGALERLPAAVDVGQLGAGEGGDNRAPHGVGDGRDGLEVALAGDGEARLEVVDAESGQLLCDLELLGRVEGDAGSLLPVPQRGVEDNHLFVGHRSAFLGCRLCCSRSHRSPDKQKTSRPGAREVVASAYAALATT